MFLDRYRTTAEIERVLWTPFPVDNTSSRTVCVVDLLNDNCPSQLICHEVVMLSLTNLWKHGPARENFARATGLSHRYDTVCTPRILHAMDLSAHLAYFGLLVSYVMHPPSQPVISHDGLEHVGPREILLMLLAASALTRPRLLFNIPFAITLLLFLASLPAVPFAGTFSFSVLLLCFAFHAFQLHFPGVPSPLFLLTVHHSLPFGGFLASGFVNIVYPLLLYFAPIGFLATYWLSLALADTFFMPPSSHFSPTPIETRTTVLMMFFAMCFAVFCSLFIFVVQGRALDDNKVTPWDIYSPRIGRDARVSFLRATIAYGRAPYTFPAPFSLLQMVLVTGPSFVLGRLGFRLPFARAERLLWRILVGPVGLLFALVMLPLP
ncbi:hypothetical protein FB45DRAFT_752107 [Roridomyces roridus]|uniref:Uncharacterized protein n=1 Tax=Roridomyces roridus TaxID=1738132 RepID=A0AAD7FJ63_9AGAR|nr:hypothetical protein FB45DRAFT_752107 [Roridomyces roridus]